MLPFVVLSLVGCPRPPLGPPSSYVVTAGDDPVWPPPDPACAPVVACCDALAALERDLALTCPIAAGARKSCEEIARAALAMFEEASDEPAPDACRALEPAADGTSRNEVRPH